MNYRTFLAAVILSSIISAVSVASEQFLIDQILCTISLGNRTEIITQSDLDRPNLDGSPRTLEQLKFERAIVLNCHAMNMMPDDQAVQQGRAQTEKDNNLSHAEFDQLFMDIGYTPAEGMEELRRMMAMNTMIDFKVRSQLAVPRSEIEAFYAQNPEMVDASYELMQVTIPFSTKKNKDEQRAMVNDFIAAGGTTKKLAWSEPFQVNHTDVATDKQFIYSMQPGEIRSVETPSGFLLFRLVKKNEAHAVPLEDRYDAIADQLRRPRYQQLMDEYKNDLFAMVNVVELQSPR